MDNPLLHPPSCLSREHPYPSVEAALQGVPVGADVLLLEGTYPPCRIHNAPTWLTIRAATQHRVVFSGHAALYEQPLVSAQSTVGLTLADITFEAASVGVWDVQCPGLCPPLDAAGHLCGQHRTCIATARCTCDREGLNCSARARGTAHTVARCTSAGAGRGAGRVTSGHGLSQLPPVRRHPRTHVPQVMQNHRRMHIYALDL